MNSTRLGNWVLPVVITVLALADGGLHFALDIVLFRGNFIGPLGPPPGAAPSNPPPGPPVPLPLQLNQMFVLNCIGYVILVALLWFALTRLPAWRLWVDVFFIILVAASILGWLDMGGPNPRGLGYSSKTVEVVLLVILLVHAWLLQRAGTSLTATRSSDQAVLAR